MADPHQYFRIKNFDKYQHYSKRRPPWIKLYHSIFTDFDFIDLPDASRYHLIAIWLLASQLDNKIPYSPEYVKRHTQSFKDVDLEALLSQGFIEVCEHDASTKRAKRPQDATPEGETETKAEVETDLVRPESGPLFETPSDAQQPPSEDPAPKLEPEGFKEFWELYPRKVGKGAARAKWKSKKCGSMNGAVTEALERQIAWGAFTVEAHLQPHASTWLNGERWTDEKPQPPPKVKGEFDRDDDTKHETF